MTETMNCGQRDCAEPATDRMFWPGAEPKLVCAPHAQAARNIGAAIGCYIHIEPLADAPDVQS